jgi:hypothetical protein
MHVLKGRKMADQLPRWSAILYLMQPIRFCPTRSKGASFPCTNCYRMTPPQVGSDPGQIVDRMLLRVAEAICVGIALAKALGWAVD